MVTPEWVRLYLQHHEDDWSDGTIKDRRHRLKNFHAWMNLREIPIENLNEQILQDFLKVPVNKPVAEYTQQSTRKSVIRYLYWLNENGKLKFDVKKVFPN
jgi:site-specific recombinase XerD